MPEKGTQIMLANPLIRGDEKILRSLKFGQEILVGILNNKDSSWVKLINRVKMYLPKVSQN